MSQSAKHRLIVLAVFAVGMVVGAITSREFVRKAATIIPRHHIAHNEKDMNFHSVVITRKICCKVEADVVFWGRTRDGSLITENPTVIEIATPEVAVQSEGMHEVVLFIWDYPAARLSVSSADLLKIDSINVEYHEFEHTCKITTSPDIGLVSTHIGGGRE